MKEFKSIFLSLVLLGACSTMAIAEEFTPLNFSDASYTSREKIAAISTTPTAATTSVKTAADTTGGKNMQSAITQLDNAQVEVRNELLNYRTKYTEVDAKYNSVKTERANLAKEIKACEKKINQIDKAKEKIRKNMI